MVSRGVKWSKFNRGLAKPSFVRTGKDMCELLHPIISRRCNHSFKPQNSAVDQLMPVSKRDPMELDLWIWAWVNCITWIKSNSFAGNWALPWDAIRLFDKKRLWGRVTHICVGKLTSIGSDNGLSPGRRQAIIWTNAGILLIGPLGTNFSEILIAIHTFSFKKMHLKMSSWKWRPFCLGLSVLKFPLIDEIRYGFKWT